MIYLDNSATTFYKPPQVINAVKNALEFLSANPGRGGHSMSAKAGLLVHKTRAHAAEYLGVKDDSRIIFTSGCTHALNLAILGSVRVGGHVITTVYEHNSVLRPLFELQRAGKISVTTLCPNGCGAVSLEQIERAVRGNTYLIATNHISNVTGAETDVKSIGEFARKKGILYLVDGAQSVGYGGVSLNGICADMIAVAPHKGLHAPQGVGILALSDRAELNPVFFGGTGTASESVYQPRELPESLESGTLPTPAIAGLNSALFWSEKNREQMSEKVSYLAEYLTDKLAGMRGVTVYPKGNARNGIVAFNVDALSSQEVSDVLSDQYDICTRGGLHCAPLVHKHFGTLDKGMVRVSFGFENTFAEADFLVKAVSEISTSG